LGIDTAFTVPFSFAEFPACGLVYSIEPPVDFITLPTNNQMIIFSKDFKDAGLYELSLVAAPPVIGVVTKIPFTIHLVDLC
jgi:hypothetical protein